MKVLNPTPGLKAWVCTSGTIMLSQEQPFDTDPALIEIHPRDVELIIGWLQELKGESEQALAEMKAEEQ